MERDQGKTKVLSEIVGKREKRKYDIVKRLGDTDVADNPKQTIPSSTGSTQYNVHVVLLMTS